MKTTIILFVTILLPVVAQILLVLLI